MQELCRKIDCPDNFDVPASSTLIIDGQALVVSLGKPQKQVCYTFGDFARMFNQAVFQYGRHFSRIDVVFDRYDQMSVKEGTRNRRKKGRAIRRIIESPDVPLPQDWLGFLSDPGNKADLSKLLSTVLIEQAPNEKCVVTAGGFQEATSVGCNRANINTEMICSTHEEADTRMILHCMHTDSQTIVIWSRDTDVLLMLMAHSSSIKKTMYMKAGTSKNQKFICINELLHAWNFSDELAKSLLPFHSLTGSDTTSFLAGHSKKTALNVFLDSSDLISKLGTEPLTTDTLDASEKFLCLIYKTPTAKTTDEARSILFRKAVKPDDLPPNSGAAKQHIRRAHL